MPYQPPVLPHVETRTGKYDTKIQNHFYDDPGMEDPYTCQENHNHPPVE